MSGEDSKVWKFFRKIGNTVLDLKKIPSKTVSLGKKIRKNARPSDQKVPYPFQNFFHQRHAGWPEYVMLKVQITIISLFVSSAAFVLVEGLWWIFGSILFLLSFYAILLSRLQLKTAFKQDYPAYRSFVGICIGIAWGAPLLLKYLPSVFEGILFEAALPLIIVTIGAIFAFIGFRVKYGRDYTYGVVKETKNDKAKVKIRYDLRSNVKQGIYFVESYTPVEKGDTVKVKVDRSMLGLRGSKAEAIMEKAPGIKRTL